MNRFVRAVTGRRAEKGGGNMNLPNVLTALRMVLIPVFVWAFFNLHPWVALAIYLLAGATDWLDGYLARKWNQVTAFGKLADPLADKLMLLSMLACLGWSGIVSWWVLFVMLVKEAGMVVGSALLLRKRNVVVMANWLGKAATVSFFLAVVAVFPWHGQLWLYQVGEYLIYLAMLISLASMVVYVRAYMSAPSEDSQR